MKAEATGWVSATVVPDKTLYKAGETVVITITGVDSDANVNDNFINITVKDPQGSVYNSRTHANPGATGPYTRSVYISLGSQPGVYPIEVNDWATGNLLGSSSFTVIPSGSSILTLEPSKYTKTNIYVPGETIHAAIMGSSNLQYTIEVTFGTQSLRKDTITTDSSGQASYDYALATEAPDGPSPSGENYAMTLTSATGGSDFDLFSVRLYGMAIGIERSAYMPGEEIVGHYLVTRLDTGEKALDGQTGTWRILDLMMKEISRGSFSTPIGDIKTSAPSTLGSFYLMGWYNTTDGKRSASDLVILTISDMKAALASPISGSTVQPGAGVTVDMFVYLGMSTPLPGIDVSVTVYRGSSAVPEYGKTGMVTVSNGHAGYAFLVASTETDGTKLKIEARASKGTTSVTDTHEITVSSKSTPGLSVSIETDKSEYFSGEVVKFTVKGSVESNPGAYNYQYTVRSGGNVFLYTVSKERTLSYQTSETFEGSLSGDVVVYDAAGNNTGATVTMTIKFAYLFVNANKLYYNPGDSVLISYSFTSAKSATPDFFYDIKDSSSVLVKSEKLTASSFTFGISTTPSSYYTITVYASFSGHLVSGSVRITKLDGFAFRASISTPQPYAAGYTPGQAIRIHYSLVALGKSTVPSRFNIDYVTIGEMDEREVLTSSAEGDVDYIVPLGTDDSVLVTLSANDDKGSSYGSTVITIPVVASPSILDLRVVGMATLGDLLLGIIVLLIVIALIVIKRQWIRSKLKKEPKTQPPMHYQPIQPAPQPYPQPQTPPPHPPP